MDEEATDEEASDKEATDEDRHILPLTGLNAYSESTCSANNIRKPLPVGGRAGIV